MRYCQECGTEIGPRAGYCIIAMEDVEHDGVNLCSMECFAAYVNTAYDEARANAAIDRELAEDARRDAEEEAEISEEDTEA